MNDRRCGCCAGTESLTPLPTANRPGLDALRYRVGTHGTFFETMVAALSRHELVVREGDVPRPLRPLADLTTRAKDDPSIALLDAWATVADVLTFYQERIANEGYLRTATERLSVLELARLVGYRLRPGVAASVYLAFTLEKDHEGEVPAGTRAQSIPAAGGLPQAFETEEALPARAAWNAIAARRRHPPYLLADLPDDETNTFAVAGAVSTLRANDALLFVCGAEATPFTVREVRSEVGTEPDDNRTVVTYAPFDTGHIAPPPEPPPVIVTVAVPPPPAPVASFATSTVAAGPSTVIAGPQAPPLSRLTSVVQALRKEPSLPPPSRLELARAPERTYGLSADLVPRLLVQFAPRLRDTLYAAYANAEVAAEPATEPCRVEAMRVKAAPFGHNAPEQVVVVDEEFSRGEWSLVELSTFTGAPASAEAFRTISLDSVYDGIVPGSRVIVSRVDRADPIIAEVETVRTVSRANYGISGKVTQLVLTEPWLFSGDGQRDLGLLRGTTVYAQNEALELAAEVIEDDVAGDEIELDGVYDGLDAGRWLLVGGERTDVVDADGNVVEGIEASELVMLAGVVHGVRTATDAKGEEILRDGEPVELPGDTLHTRLLLSEPLAYTYRRKTVKVNANVARATHGETRREILGSGDGRRPFQQFTLKQNPLTYLAAPTPSGVESTLEVRVDDVRWPERETLLYLSGDDRGYVTRTDDDGRTAVVFGDGRRGARLPSGVENVSAVYRSGIGRAGNVGAGEVTVLATRPLGVKEVVNPQRSSGGADPETRDQARRNAPIAVLALDRLVSVQDYADFARVFAGIGKASAEALSDGRRRIVHLTVAGADDVPIDRSSDLHRSLSLALNRLGDPSVPLQVDVREAVFLFLAAHVTVSEDRRWSDVEPRLRAALLERFGFDRRELGEDVLLSEVIATMHGIEGVEFVDVDLFDGVSETEALDAETLAERLASFAEGSAPTHPGCAPRQPRPRVRVEAARIDPSAADAALRVRPAQIAYFNPELPDTLVLAEAAP